jgi:hypothetical protein
VSPVNRKGIIKHSYRDQYFFPFSFPFSFPFLPPLFLTTHTNLGYV